MPWDKAYSYRAIIGGCYFANIPIILRYEGDPFVTVKKRSEDNMLGIDTDILDNSGNKIATINNNEISLHLKDQYDIVSVGHRSAIVEKETGKVVYDMKFYSIASPVEAQISLITHLPNGLPIFLHPNRIKLGSVQITNPHFISLRLASEQSEDLALRIELAATAETAGYMLMPQAPIVGIGGGVVTALSTVTNDDKQLAISTLNKVDNNSKAFFNLTGPRYLLDTAFENFETAISIFSPSDEINSSGRL